MIKKIFIFSIIFLIFIIFFLNNFNLNNKIDKAIVKLDGGSGVIINKKGFILTSLHNIKENNKVIYNNKEYEYRLIKSYVSKDIAILKIYSQLSFNYIKLDKNNLKINKNIYTLSYPYNGILFLSKGNIKALKNIKEGNIIINNVLEIDAKVYPGSSGGALMYKNNLIGIITAIKNNSSFAIPIKDIDIDINKIYLFEAIEIDSKLEKILKIKGIITNLIELNDKKENNILYKNNIINLSNGVLIKINNKRIYNLNDLKSEIKKLSCKNQTRISYFKNKEIKNIDIITKYLKNC